MNATAVGARVGRRSFTARLLLGALRRSTHLLRGPKDMRECQVVYQLADCAGKPKLLLDDGFGLPDGIWTRVYPKKRWQIVQVARHRARLSGRGCSARPLASQRTRNEWKPEWNPGAISLSEWKPGPISLSVCRDGNRGTISLSVLGGNRLAGGKPARDWFVYQSDRWMESQLACRLGRRLARFPWAAFGRTVCSNPRSFTVSRTHFSSLYGRLLSMLTGTRSNSLVVKEALTRAVQFAGRSTGQGENNALRPLGRASATTGCPTAAVAADRPAPLIKDSTRIPR